MHKQEVASKRQLFYALLHSNYTPDTLKKVIKTLQEEQHIDEAKDLLKFTAKYKIAEENLIQGLNHAYSLSTDQTLRACKQHIACEVLSQQLTKSSPTHGPPLYKNLSSLILLGCNYETIHAFIAHIFSPTAKAHFTRNASELKIALDLLTTYHPVVSVCEDALQFLVQEKDPNKWESEIHRRVIEATFLDSHERSIEEITTYIAEKSSDTHFAGDTKALHTAYKQVCEAYENPTSLRNITIKTTKKSDDGSEDITEEHTISTPSGAIKSWSKSDIKQWTHAVKSSIQQRGASSVPQAEMIAVLKQAVYLEYGYYPRNTQIMTLLTALNHVENQGRLLQVNTGEGKSLIIAMLAVIHALQGKKVDIVTSSVELSIPEAERKRSFFNLFELTVGENSTKHKEEDDNSDDEADNSNDQAKQKQDKEDNDKKEVYQKDIIYGVSSDFQADILKTEFFDKDIRGDRGFGVVLVDEVDNLLFDERNASLKISSPTPGMNHLELVLATIWKYVNEVAKYIIEIEGKTYFITQEALLRKYYNYRFSFFLALFLSIFI